MPLLNVGDPAPNFSSLAVGGAYDGRTVSLADFRGRTLVLYFYPKDDTPGCTKQACGLRDAWSDFGGKAEVFGVSADPAAKHAKFIAKYWLPFPLLSDPDRTFIEACGLWVEKSLYGLKYWGIERTTVVIGPDGIITAIFRKVKPAAHAAQLLAVL